MFYLVVLTDKYIAICLISFRTFAMDLFTIDTVGEDGLLDQNAYDDSEILYTQSKPVEIPAVSENKDKSTQNNDDEEQDANADEIDYLGKRSR